MNKHTFPTERRYEGFRVRPRNVGVLHQAALRNGTTTALVFGTVHPQSVDALFEAASHINMRMIAGKVMMDRNAPDYLLDTAESSYHQSKELIERWHKMVVCYMLLRHASPLLLLLNRWRWRNA